MKQGKNNPFKQALLLLLFFFLLSAVSKQALIKTSAHSQKTETHKSIPVNALVAATPDVKPIFIKYGKPVFLPNSFKTQLRSNERHISCVLKSAIKNYKPVKPHGSRELYYLLFSVKDNGEAAFA